MKKMKDLKWLQVSKVIFDIFYPNIIIVGRNVMLNNNFGIFYEFIIKFYHQIVINIFI